MRIIRQRMTLVSDSMCLGVRPAQEHRCRAVAKRPHVTDLGHADRHHGGAYPVDGLDRPVAGVVAQPPIDLGLEHGDLPVVELDQIAQRLHPDRVALIEGNLV
jgi:hypothetical protein